MPAESFLIGDIGGTYARFALTDSAAPGYRRERVHPRHCRTIRRSKRTHSLCHLALPLDRSV